MHETTLKSLIQIYLQKECEVGNVTLCLNLSTSFGWKKNLFGITMYIVQSLIPLSEVTKVLYIWLQICVLVRHLNRNLVQINTELNLDDAVTLDIFMSHLLQIFLELQAERWDREESSVLRFLVIAFCLFPFKFILHVKKSILNILLYFWRKLSRKRNMYHVRQTFSSYRQHHVPPLISFRNPAQL